MTAKQTLSNNGLPEGLHFKDIEAGDILLIKWIDVEPTHGVVLPNSCHLDKRANYKGWIDIRVLMLGSKYGLQEVSVEGDQVIKKVSGLTLVDVLNQLDLKLEADVLKVRYE